VTTPAEALPPSTYRFADLTLDAARRSVRREGQAIELKALDFDLLRFLVESAPNVVNADVLAEKVWGRHFVSPENVAQRVMLLRQSLADDASRPRYIETVRNKGYRLIPVVERVAAGPSHAPRQPRRWLVPATAAALLLAVGAAAAARYWLAEPAAEAPPSPSSVAVLPFENLSPDPADAYLAVAMQDELVSQLTKIGGLRVVPVSPGTGAPPDVPDLARDLNVASVLYGSVYHAEGRVRVTPRLTDTASVSLWSSAYERERSDIFGIQADIALEVARTLRVEPSAAERENVVRVPTANRRAHDLYLSAKALSCCYDDLDDLKKALADIEQALELDRAFKEAWVAKANILCYLAILDGGNAKEHHRLSQQAALRALEIDSELGAAYRVLGQALALGNDWRGAETAFGKARSLNEPLAAMNASAILQLAAGKFGPVARDIMEEVRAANPRTPVGYRLLMFVYGVLGDSERASDLYADALRMFPGDNRESRLLQIQRMHSLIGRNELAEARAIPLADPFNSQMLGYLDDAPEHALAELRHALGAYDSGAYGPEYPTRYYDIGLWAAYFGDPALAFEAMRKFVDTGGGRMAFVWMPQLAAMRRLPEFETYLREIGMVAYWQEFGWPPFCRQIDSSDFECN
jgi:TolB-like protein/DNA-binding winged helix-turn-helix (wHTH) protein/Tfp pilus assembly protein PilF